MAEEQLHSKLTTGATFLGGEDFYQKKGPEYIFQNLKDGFGQRPYQKEAFGRFVYYLEDYPNRPKGVPTQLLYHMATGSGKTLVMAGLMLYLYEKGYHNFLFFVNSTNIIDKTRDNFLNVTAGKYLFADTVQIGDKQIRIKEVDNFSAANQDDINIVFSTIQGLHMRLNTPKENTITFEDFEDKKIVLISDEAHHINAETKKGNDLSQTELFEVTSWEQTVTKIFNANTDNILLEFTATADLNNPDIERKYRDKIIYDYPLKEFRKDGYSKEVKVLQADLNDFERAIQAIILSQFRLKVFAKHSQLIKPVILFKSKTIKESESFYEDFSQRLKKLSATDLEKIKNNPNLDPVLQNTFQYFNENGITLANLAAELKEDFSDDKCIVVNSKSESEEKQIAVNSLEDERNEYRAVFAVDQLNEGWDVLNLFDIVRLYNLRDAKAGKPGKTTMSEAQLIGRGARYCPFQLSPDQPLYQRKFDVRDEDEEHELKICEELYYHSAYNPRYIDELHTALEEIGIKAKDVRQKQLKMKLDFQETTFYKTGFVFLNEQKKYNREDIFSIPKSFIDTTHKVPLATGYTKSSGAFEKQEKTSISKKQKDYNIKDFGQPIIRKALNRLEFYHFDNLRKYLPNLESVSLFISDNDYLGKVKVEVEGSEAIVNNLTPEHKLEITVKVLEKLASALQSDKVEYKGTKEFKPYMLKDKFKDKTLNIANDDGGDKEYGIGQGETTNQNLHLDLSDKKWYVFNENYGTSEEKYFVRYINKVYDQLKNKYDEVYLVRNERHFKIYTFNDGRPIEPDFVLFLVQKDPKKAFHYQIFIEPKGGHLLKTDEWKESFLKVLKEEHRIEQLWEGKEYIIWGMPFYNEVERKADFEKAFEKLIK
ncbi:MAG: DEAD/DEAH box helicase family protein [Flavobacteriales bacterium]|nr:DEAD/DEAH box helicase family protein [Flavobacteriales bacterium]